MCQGRRRLAEVDDAACAHMECAREHPPRLEDSNRWPNLPALPAFRGTHTSVLLDDSMLVHVSSRWDWL